MQQEYLTMLAKFKLIIPLSIKSLLKNGNTIHNAAFVRERKKDIAIFFSEW